MSDHRFSAHFPAEDALGDLAHETLDLLYATGSVTHDAALHVWLAAGHPRRWRAEVERPGGGRRREADSPEAAIEGLCSRRDEARVALAELRRKRAPELAAVARAFAVLRDAGNTRDMSARVEAHVARRVLRARPWLVMLEWRPLLDVAGRRERVSASIHATFGDFGARLDSAAVPEYLTVASAHELAARLAHVARTLDAATAALTVEHRGDDGR